MKKMDQYVSPGINLRVILFAVAALIIFAFYGTHDAKAANQIVQTFYVPITEPQARTWMRAQTATAEADTIHSVISITGTYDGTTIYYDHWEDGYEDDITNPQQSTTQVITINAGQVITFADDIPVANGIRDQGNLYHDGMDKISATQQIVVTRAFWPNGAPQTIGAQMAGAVEVFETNKWGSNFEVPVGINNGSVSFNYTALSISAQKNGTSVTVQNRDLSVNVTQTLNEGQTFYVEGIKVGATVTSTGGPVQVDMLTAQSPSGYDGRLYSLLPISNLGNTYYSPVSTTRETGGTMVYNNIIAYNPNSASITVNVTCMAGTAGCPVSQTLLAHTAGFFQLPLSPTSPGNLTGAKLTTTGGESFYAIAAIDINNTVHNWGFNMIPETSLTTSAVVGWSPGTTDKQRDANPIWVTAVTTTTVYVDYDGDPTTGPILDSLGNHCDVAINVQALEAQKIFSPGPAGSYDHTGWRVYTTDNTRIAVAYGQDGGSSSANQPTELDLGTTVLPFPSLVAYKYAELIGDFNSNGGIDPGELLEYTIRVHNSGIVPISSINLLDTLDTNTTYVANTTTMDGSALSDNASGTRFPLDETGYPIPSTLQPGQDILFTFQATVNNPLSPTTTTDIINNAKVTSVAEIFLNTRDSVVQQGVLQTLKTSSIAPNKVKPGDNITYTITVTNASSTSQTGIQLNDPLPDGTNYIASSTSVTGHRQKLVKEKFNQLLYSNNDGPENWAANWSENDAAGNPQDPLTGNVQVINGSLRLTAAGSWASRTANLTTGIPAQNFTSATLSFDFRTSPSVAAADAVQVIMSGNGHGLTVIDTINNITGQTTGTKSYDISSYIGSDTTVRFSVSNGYAGDYFYADNVAIKTNELPVTVTKDNITGGSNPDLINGVPPNLVMPADGFALAAGETMTITYTVQAKNPINETRIVNTATATSYEKAPPASSTTIDPVSTGGAIGDLVWLDTVPNGVHDTGEPGLYNVRVWLDTNNNGVFDAGDLETRTGTDGKYVFDGLLPGTYRVYVDETTLPPGLTISTNNNPTSPIVITGQEQFLNNDFGYKNAGSNVAIIGDYVWSDANNNGIQEPGELGLGGVTMELVTSPGNVHVAWATTNAFGIYLFTNVSPGTYVVKSDTAGILSGYSPTVGPQSIGANNSAPITVTGGNSYVMMDFGYYNPSLYTISDRVWFDLNDNAALDPGEPGIKGVTITLLKAGNVVAAVTTSDVYGNFSFTGVPNGSYTISIEDANGKLIGFAGTTTAAQAGNLAVTVLNANVSGTNFGYNAPGKIGDTIWSDYNRNGIQEIGEPGIAGVTVKLYKDTNGNGLLDTGTDQLVATTTTDADGKYMFQVSEEGRFFVSIDDGQTPLSGLVLTTNDDQPSVAGAQRTVLFLNLNTSDLTADFGYNAPGTSAITGLVWNDLNSNKSQDTGEAGISGVTVQLYSDTNSNNIFDPSTDTLVATTTTDSGGYYSFQVSSIGKYFVSIDDTQSPLISKTLTTTDDWPLAPGDQKTVSVTQLNATYPNNNFGFAAAAVSNLVVTKVSSAGTGNVAPGDTITYTITITNNSATTTQTGITVYDLLPTYTTYVNNSTVVKGAPSNNTISSVILYAVKDTYLDQQNPTYNYGSVEPMSIQYRAGRMRQPLVQFDLSSILSTARVGSALMEFNVSTANANLTANAYGLTRDWNEGTRNPGAVCSAGTGNGATWNQYNCANTWTTGGGDYSPTLLGSFIVSPVGYRGINTANLLTSVQNWVTTPANNHGVILIGTAGANQTAAINSRSSANDERLTVRYDTKTNRVGDPNPLTNGVSPNLLMPADGFSLNPGESMTVTYQVQVNSSLPSGVTQIFNEAAVSSAQSATTKASVGNPVTYPTDLQVTKAVQSIDAPCYADGTCHAVFLITLKNVGTTTVTAAQVTDALPANLAYSSYTATAGTATCSGCNSTGGGTLTWTVASSITGGSSVTLTLTTIVQQTETTIQNCANLASSTPADSNSNNNTSCTSISPTHVVLSDFRAYEDNGSMVIEWTTSSESGTAGFYLFRKDASTGGYQRINRRLLPALLTSLQGGTYSLIDKGASPEQSYTYLLMEVEAGGAKNIHGPFTVSTTGTAINNLGRSNAINPELLLNPPKVSTNTVVRSFASDGSSNISVRNDPYKTTVDSGQDLYSNYVRKAKENTVPKATQAVHIRALAASTGSASIQTGTSIKIPVSTNGLYSLSSSTIATLLGISEQKIIQLIKNNGLQLTNKDQKAAYMPDAGNAGILFYGTGISNDNYTDENIYWLAVGNGVQMVNVKGKGPQPVAGNNTFTETIHVEQDNIIVPVITTDPESDYWFWDYIVAGDPDDGVKTFTIQANGVANASGSLSINLQGFTNTKHHASFKLNGTQIADTADKVWYGPNPKTITINYSPGQLYEGSNTVEITGLLDNPDTDYSIFYLNSFDLTYQRLYHATNNSLVCHDNTNPVVTITGFTGPDLSLFDITDPLNPRNVTAAKITSTGGGYALSFNPASSGAVYLALKQDAVIPIPTANVRAGTVPWLKDNKNKADYIIITTAELSDAANTLAAYRSNQGLTVQTVLLEEILNEFNYGIYSPEAIRDFLSYAYHSWKKAPGYVVLAGNGTFDYKNNLGKNDNLIPTLMTSTPSGVYPSDNLFAEVENDHVPRIAIGRLPVLTASDLTNVINKIAVYEGATGNKVIMLADVPDDAGAFTKDSNAVLALLTKSYSAETIYLAGQPVGTAHDTLMDWINNKGIVFLNYIGHGGVDHLAMQPVLTEDDVVFHMTNSTKLPVMAAMTCVVGEYGIPGYNSLSEVLVLQNGGGAAAVWSPTGMSFDSEALILDEEFFKAGFKAKKAVLGDVILKALNGFNKAGGQDFMMDIYNLLGDPALKLR